MDYVPGTDARRLLKESAGRADDAVPRAWTIAFGRPATPAELERARTFLRARSVNPEAALADLCLALFNANEFIYVD